MPATPITIDPTSPTMFIGGTVQLTVSPTGGVKWSTSNCPCVSVKRGGEESIDIRAVS